MKKLFILALIVLVGIGLFLSDSTADSTRTIPFKTGFANSENTHITANAGRLYMISGIAASATAIWAVYDEDAITDTIGTDAKILVEGGEATQYDSFPLYDFGDEGIPFSSGLVVITSTADVTLLYR